MRRLPSVVALLAISYVLIGCSRSSTASAGSCAPVTVRLAAAYYTGSGPAQASDAGEPFGVVQRQRRCEDVFVVEGNGSPRLPEPWVDGDADGLSIGTVLYAKVGIEDGSRLVAVHHGEWIELSRAGSP